MAGGAQPRGTGSRAAFEARCDARARANVFQRAIRGREIREAPGLARGCFDGRYREEETVKARARKTKPSSEAPKEKLKRKDYDKELARLHAELVKLQEWVKYKGLKVCVVFEGRDGAGKGGTIKAITERVSPRVFRVVALPAPTEREKSQM